VFSRKSAAIKQMAKATLGALILAAGANAVAAVDGTVRTEVRKHTGDIPKEEIKKFLEETKDIRSQALPMNQFIVSQRGNTVLFVSDNGRYKFTGPVIDTWNKIEINNFNDAMFSAENLPLKEMGFNAEMLNPLRFGDNPSQPVVVFVSPDDLQSRRLLSELPTLKKSFEFTIIVVPTPQTPFNLMAYFACNKDQDTALARLLDGKNFEHLPTPKGCSVETLSNRLLSYRILGLNQLPSVITPTGRLSTGDRPDGWTQFLMENMQ